MLIGLSLAIGSRERAGDCGRAQEAKGRDRGQFKRAEREGNEGSQFVEPAPRQGRSGPPRLVSDWEAWGGGIQESRRTGAGEEAAQGRGQDNNREGGRELGRRWMDGQSSLAVKREGNPPRRGLG